jgi:hypothetical protein
MATKTAKAKKPAEAFKLIQKRSGRWSVKGADGKFINGAEKVTILQTKGKIKTLKSKKVADAPAAE